jgi:inorganic pyrophosphatase
MRLSLTRKRTATKHKTSKRAVRYNPNHMNLLHDVDPGTKSEMNVIIEIPKGSHNKYEIDKATGLIALDRVAHTAQSFPFDYGFVPQTLWDDGDALDVILLTTYPLLPGILVHARPVALTKMIDGGDADDKVIAVPIDDPRWNNVQDLGDVNKHTLKEIEHFFTTYKKLQNKEVVINGFEDRAAAEAAFDRAREMYAAKK